jgi:hypothetical protein
MLRIPMPPLYRQLTFHQLMATWLWVTLPNHAFSAHGAHVRSAWLLEHGPTLSAVHAAVKWDTWHVLVQYSWQHSPASFCYW